MLEIVKKALRISATAFDDEITDLVEAARQDLVLSGVTPEIAKHDEDPLIKRAIITYCKANFGYDNPDADRFASSYQALKEHLTLAGEYNVPLV